VSDKNRVPDKYCYVNGQIVPADQALISVFDHGFTVADGVFETLKFESGKAFALDRHLRRLEKSCLKLGIAFPDLATLIDAIKNTAKANEHVQFGRMRITVTSGVGPLGSDRLDIEPTLVISVAEQKNWPESTELLLVPWTRNENSAVAGIKTTSYAENVLALDAAQKLGFAEAIFLNTKGELCEGTGSNVFVVDNGEIKTPTVSSGLLPGITRELVLEWIPTSHPISEDSLNLEEFLSAEEIFITSSTRDIQPVTKIAVLTADGRVINNKSLNIGKVTQEVIAIFKKTSSESVNP